MGSFILSIKNAPSGSKYWWADYSQGMSYSGYLDISEAWDCPYGAYGAADLHIWVVDTDYNTLHNKYGLGPIHDDKSYVYDCSSEKLSEEVPPGGTITRKVLEYNESRTSIPADNVPQYERGLVHIWGRNDSAEAQRMGIGWTVTDPNGAILEQYSAWEAWPYTGAGKEHEFIGGRFPLNYVGACRIAVGLYIYPDGTNSVDSYSGTLCTVKAELVPEFSELKISNYVKV